MRHSRLNRFVYSALILQFFQQFSCQTHQSSYNFANMGLSMTCDFEWSMCGWTQEATPHDQLDWRRHRGASSGSSYYKIAGDHTPGKDAFGFYMYLDGADYRRPFVDPEIIDSIEHPEPDELLAQQLGLASSLKLGRSFTGPLHRPPFFSSIKKFNVQRLRVPRMAASYQNYRNTYIPPVPTGSRYNRYPDPVPDPYSASTYRRTNVDTNSDVKPYELLNYNSNNANPPPGSLPPLPPALRHLNQQPLAILVGPRIETPVNLTFKFWYHMRGGNVGRLTLYRKVLARPDQIIWEKTGHQSFDWTEGQVMLERGSFQLRFEGAINPRGNPAEGYIGLDDLLLEREAELPMLINALSFTTPTPLQYLYQHRNQGMPSSFHLSPQGPQIIQTQPATTAAPRHDFPLISSLKFHQNLLESLARGTLMLTTDSLVTELSTTTAAEILPRKPPNILIVRNNDDGMFLQRRFPENMPNSDDPNYASKVTAVKVTRTPVTKKMIEEFIVPETEISPDQNFISKSNWTKLPSRPFEFDPKPQPKLLLPILVTSTAETRLIDDPNIALMEQTEISAVIQENPVDKSKIYLSILSCLGVIALAVIIIILVKRGKQRVFDLIPRWNRRRHPPANLQSHNRPNGRQTRRLPPPPPQPSSRR